MCAGPRGLRASKRQQGYYAWLFLSTDSSSPPPGPRRRLEIEQSQPVSGEQSTAPTRGSTETAADAGVARGPGGARRGCHDPGPAARAAASRGVPAVASMGGPVLSAASPEKGPGSVARTPVPWAAASALPRSRLGRRQVSARRVGATSAARAPGFGLDGAGNRISEPGAPTAGD